MDVQSSFLPPPEITFNCYHDESGTYAPNAENGGEQWLFHGILLVPQNRQAEFVTQLQEVRAQIGYFGELHYKNLRKPAGPIAACTKGWLKCYLNYSKYCYYHCLAINAHSTQFNHSRFPEPYYCYNYFARTAIVSAVAWSLAHYHNNTVNLHIFSDPKRRGGTDNFASYIPLEVNRAIHQKKQAKPAKYPTLAVTETVYMVSSDPNQVEVCLRDECELIQLVDLLTSNIA